MALQIQEREKEGIVILDVDGRLVVGEACSQVRENIQAIAAGGRNRVILNMKEVTYVDSTGLGALVICYTTLKKAGGELKLLNLSRRNIELLVLTKLTTVFEIFTDEQDAVNSFFPDRQIKRFDILSFVEGQSES